MKNISAFLVGILVATLSTLLVLSVFGNPLVDSSVSETETVNFSYVQPYDYDASFLEQIGAEKSITVSNEENISGEFTVKMPWSYPNSTTENESVGITTFGENTITKTKTVPANGSKTFTFNSGDLENFHEWGRWEVYPPDRTYTVTKEE